jgi:hypothetical protein
MYEMHETKFWQVTSVMEKFKKKVKYHLSLMRKLCLNGKIIFYRISERKYNRNMYDRYCI